MPNFTCCPRADSNPDNHRAAKRLRFQEGKAADSLHILLDGTLTVTVSQSDNNPLARAFTAMEGGEALSQEVARLLSGEVVGEIPFISVRPIATTVKAVEKSLVMSSQQQLAVKLQQDVGFAERFYRAIGRSPSVAIAILLSDRLQSLINQVGRSNLTSSQPVRSIIAYPVQLSRRLKTQLCC